MAAEPEVGTKRRREEEEEQEKAGRDAAAAGEAAEDSGEDDDDEEEDDDSDVEFILGPTDAKPAAPVAEKKEPEAPKSGDSAPPEAAADSAAVPAATAATTQSAAQPAESSPAPAQQHGSLDIDAVGTYNGQPISQVPPSSFDDKPWRRPGADLSDYFNYGFDEFTWMAYCSRQDKLRAHFTPQQLMQSMSMGAPMGGPMPPMGGPMGTMPPMPFMMPPMMFPPADGSRQ